MVHWGTLILNGRAPIPVSRIDMLYIYNSVGSYIRFTDASSLVHLVHQFTGSPDAPVHWFTWCTGSLVHLVHRCAGSPGAPVRWFTWCTGALVHLVHRCAGSPGAPVRWFTWCTGSLVHLVHRCTGSPEAVSASLI